MITASAAVILLGIACVGYLFRPMSWPKRIWAIGAALFVWERRQRALSAPRVAVASDA